MTDQPTGDGGGGGTGDGLNYHLRHVAGRDIAFDEEGFFRDHDDWSEEAAQELAVEGGLAALDEVRWRVLRFYREFYGYHGRAPMNRDLKKGTGLSIMELEGLFPGGLKNGARRLAGLPNPKTCN